MIKLDGKSLNAAALAAIAAGEGVSLDPAAMALVAENRGVIHRILVRSGKRRGGGKGGKGGGGWLWAGVPPGREKPQST